VPSLQVTGPLFLEEALPAEGEAAAGAAALDGAAALEAVGAAELAALLLAEADLFTPP
jgi:hypothetical protein